MARARWLLLALVLCGCPNPHTYSPPRTLPKGKSSHAVALEAFELRTNARNWRAPTAPTYVYRLGLGDEVDAGVRAVNMASVAIDVKYNFLRSDVDLAVDPSAQLGFLAVDEADADAVSTFVDLPLLVGLNVAPELTIVLGGGAAFISGDTYGRPELRELSDEQLFARGTAGLDLRLTRRIAVHPTLTYFHGVQTGDASAAVFGCGLRFGGPEYEGLSF